MEIFTVRCFAAVARLGSFSRAAQELYRSQPAISLQVRKLEEELGQPLLDRSRRSPRLNEAGRIFLDEARDILERLDGLPGRLSRETAEMAGTLVIASNASLISSYLPPVLTRFHRAFPRVVLRLLNLTARGIGRAVGEGAADLGVGFLLEKDPRLLLAPLAHSGLLLVCPRNTPAARAGRLSLTAALEGHLVHFEEGAELRRHLELSLGDRGRFVPVLELPTIESILQYVGLGFGSSILPDFAVGDHWRRTLATKPLGRSVPRLEISACLHRRRPLSRSAAALKALLTKHTTTPISR